MEWLILVVLLVGLAVLALVFLPRMQSQRLRRRFGPEYDRVLEEQDGDRRRTDSVLRERMNRWASLELSDLDAGSVAAFRTRWRETQLGFVDDPAAAVVEGHELIREVMRRRGYPSDSFAARVEMLSVGRPDLAEQYRVACATEMDAEAGRAPLDDQRRAFQQYRALFVEVLGDHRQAPPAEPVDLRPQDDAEEERIEGMSR